MAISDRIKQAPTAALHGLPCSIGVLEATLDGAEAAALHTMLYDLGWNASQVYEALRDEGYPVPRQSINRHRGKRCRCDQAAS